MEPQPAAHRASRTGLAIRGILTSPDWGPPGTRGTGGRSAPGWPEAGQQALAAALAAERPLLAGRAVRTVDLPGVLAAAPAAGVGLLGALAFQCLAELAPRLVLGARSVGTRLARGTGPALGTRLALRTFRPRRRVSHAGLLPPADTPSLAHPAATDWRPVPRHRTGRRMPDQKGMNGKRMPEASALTVASGGASRRICSASSRASSSLLAPTTRNFQRWMTVRPSLRSLSASATASWRDGNSTLASHWAAPVARDSA